MKLLIVLGALLAVVSCRNYGGEEAHNLVELLHEVTRKYHDGDIGVHRLRRRSPQEYQEIMKNFAESVALTDKINSDPNLRYSSEYNSISIMTNAEKAALLGHFNASSVMARAKRSRATRHVQLEKREPARVDWNSRGALNWPKNQGGCGSCWAFSANAPLEANYYILTGEKRSFSEQEALDCVHTASGCSGGWPEYVYDYSIASGHLADDAGAPYRGSKTGVSGSVCKWANAENGLAKAKLVSYASSSGDAGLQTALQSGVVSVCIKVEQSFGGYREGVYTCTESTCNDWINHAVAVVGYGTLNGERYWNVRNSWGHNWGDGGYIKMTRDDAAHNNANIHRVDHLLPVLECRAGQNCEAPTFSDSYSGDDNVEPAKGADVECGVLRHSGGRCLSIDDSSNKYVDLSIICERTWCLTNKGYLYEKATDLCANVEESSNSCIDTYYNSRYPHKSCAFYAASPYFYCTQSRYVATMLRVCKRTCGLCQDTVKMQGVCKTKWDKTSAGGIQARDDERYIQPLTGGDDAEESTLVTLKADSSATFAFETKKCWEVEHGKKLTGGVRAGCAVDNFPQADRCPKYAALGHCTDPAWTHWIVMNCKASCLPYLDNSACKVLYPPGYFTKEPLASSKEGCLEKGAACGGVNWYNWEFTVVPNGAAMVLEATDSASDRAYVLVDCEAACNAGEERCMDGDCKADCGVECNAAAGMRMCSNGECKHQHMDCDDE